jgi:hypothetical protein
MNGHRLVWWPFCRTSKRKIGPLDQGDGKAVVYEGVLLSEVLKKAGVPAGGGMRDKALTSYFLRKLPTPSAFPSFDLRLAVPN